MPTLQSLLIDAVVNNYALREKEYFALIHDTTDNYETKRHRLIARSRAIEADHVKRLINIVINNYNNAARHAHEETR